MTVLQLVIGTLSNTGDRPPVIGPVLDVSMTLGGSDSTIYFPTSNSPGSWSVVSSDPVNAPVTATTTTWFVIGNVAVTSATITMTQSSSPGFISAVKIIGVSTVAIPRMLFSMGSNTSGELGLMDTVARSTPVQVGSLNDWGSSTYGSSSVKSDGTLWVWGPQSVLGDTVPRSSPVQVGSLNDWAQVHSMAAIKKDGTLWAWGSHLTPQPTSTIAYRSSPVQVGSLTNWAKVSQYTAIKTDGTLWVWGNNSSGQFGNNTSGTALVGLRSSPGQVGSLTNWATVTYGYYCIAAIKTDGTLWTWGNTQWGQLGLNIVSSTVHKSSPTQVGARTNWSSVAVYQHFAATKTDGTLWVCGYNANGQLGLGDTVSTRYSPVQVGSLTNWLKVAVNSSATVAIKTDGTLWAWGTASNVVPLNSRSSPVQVGTSTAWKYVSYTGSFLTLTS